MSKVIVLGGCVVSAALAFGLAACMPHPQGQNQAQGQNQGQNQAYAQNQPVNPNQPAPYLQPGDAGGNMPSPWPGAQPDGSQAGNTPAAMPGGFVEGPGGREIDQTQPLTLGAAPAGMQPVRSQAGYVFRADLSGTNPIPQQSRDFYMKLIPYFDAQPQVMGYLDDPSGRMSQVGFQATKNGTPVMGMMMVARGANGGVSAVVMLDSPQRFQQSMQAMMAAAQ